MFAAPRPVHQPLKRHRSHLAQHDLCILGGLSGRLDQTIHTLHALTQLSSDPARVQSAPQGARVWALSAESLACVLPPGKHLLRAPVQPENDGAGEDATHFFFGRTCGVLPVGAEARVATKGLSWNLGPSDCGSCYASPPITGLTPPALGVGQTCTRPRSRLPSLQAITLPIQQAQSS